MKVYRLRYACVRSRLSRSAKLSRSAASHSRWRVSSCAIPEALPGRSWGCSPRSSASLCSRAESQRPPSRSSRRPSSARWCPSTNRAASAASTGRALPLGRSPVSVGRAPPAVAAHAGQYDEEVVLNGLDPVGRVRRAVVAHVERMRVRRVLLPDVFPSGAGTGRRGAGQQGVHGPVLVHVQDARLPARTVLERQPGLSRGLAHVLGGPGRYCRQGIRVTAADAPEVDGKFVYADLGTAQDRTAPHTVRFWIEVNPGPDNDLVRIAVDGRDVGQCFATWENYYRTRPETAPPPNINTPADINSLQFRSSVPGPPALATGGGYLFDNVSITPSNGPGPPRLLGR